MTRGRWTPFLAAVFVLVPLGLHGLEGCYTPAPNDGLVDAGPPPKTDVSVPEAGEGFVGFGTTTCSAVAGDVPPPNCHVPFPNGVTALTCTPKSTACVVSKTSTGASCGESLCLPMASNSGPVKSFRMEALYIAAPTTLSSGVIQNTVVTGAVTLNNETTCGYGASQGLGGGAGNGLFNWILQVDTQNKTLTTGGAPFSTDPYKDGYCFADGTITADGGSVTVKPLSNVPIQISGNTFTLAPQKETLDIPIFLSAMPGQLPIILPIGGARLTATISPDGNCIGDINPAWYPFGGGGTGTTACQDNSPGGCPKWFTNGSLAGYITLKDSMNVNIAALGVNLCTFLGSCTKGDYCSTTGKAGGCADSYWLSATFAANAVVVNPHGPAPCKP